MTGPQDLCQSPQLTFIANRKTVRKYLAPAEAAGTSPGGPLMSETDWAKLLKSWSPRSWPAGS
ncbi:hypothetical protein [Streptomyces caeruleatus]|uniref:hypothetical protein n=1 Tax=Streptomyces caeruleatus TaxID=661399 RepID=UPI00131BC768|nr:hypothetical protein [Streptomyces caeruleatus]